MSGRVILVIVSLSVVAGGLGLSLGLRPPVSESQVIEAGVAIYVAETGGSGSDCVGVPGRDAVWIEVRCGETGALETYLFDRDGALMPQPEEPST